MEKKEYYHRIEKAIEFIEANLNRKLPLSSVSKSAFSSLSHFHRIFYFMTGLTIKEYIRYRRMSNAAMLLISSNKSVLDISLQSQFDSPESFNKSFKKMFDLSPSEFRKRKPEFVVTRKMELPREIDLKMPDNISLEFVYLSQQIIVGVKTRTTLEDRQQTKDIPQFFYDVMKNNMLSGILNVSDHQKLFGVYSDMTDEEEFDYTVGLLVEKSIEISEKYANHLLPMAEYARFSVQGDTSRLEDAWRYIYGIWMPNSGRSRQAGLDFEIYFSQKTDIYIPMQSQKIK